MAKRVKLPEKVKIILIWVFRAIVIVVCAYGLYIFIDRCFWEELFYLIDYTKEYNYEKHPFVYFLESMAMSALFVAAAYYTKKLFLFLKRRNKKEIEQTNEVKQ